METVHAIVLFVLGMGAAFLAYFAWLHIYNANNSATETIDTSNVVPFHVNRPGVSRQA